MGKTLFDKLWDRHVITGEEGQAQLLYVDLHMIHEVTTPQAFEGLRQAGRTVRCPEKNLRNDGSQRAYQRYFYHH